MLRIGFVLIIISSLVIVVAAFQFQYHRMHCSTITTAYHRTNIIMANNKDAMSIEEECNEANQPIIYRYESPFFPATKSSPPTTPPSALIILNTPIKFSGDDNTNYNQGILSGVLGKLWEASSYRICADGGANRLYDATVSRTTSIQQEGEERSNNNDNNNFLPDLITGDLDSLRLDVRQYYETRGVSIIRVEDQNFHDLDKSMMAVEKWIGEQSLLEKQQQPTTNTNINSRNNDGRLLSNNKTRTFIYGGFGGRFDQEMGVINTLFVWGNKQSFQQTALAVYNEETCAFVLPEIPIKSEILIRYPDGDSTLDDDNDESDTHFVGEGPTCGLIPILGRCDKVITTGLKWNLEGDEPMEFGGLVSSSNRVMNEVVTVETSSPMLFTTEMIVKDENNYKR